MNQLNKLFSDQFIQIVIYCYAPEQVLNESVEWFSAVYSMLYTDVLTDNHL